MTPQELKNSILQLAIQGKLVEQRPEEGTAEELYHQIQREKQALIKAGMIKKEKPLPEIPEEEKPFEIPENWMWIRFGFLSQLLDGEKRQDESFPCLDAKYLRGKNDAQLLNSGKFVYKGEKIILVDGENSGEVFVVPQDGYMGSTFKKLFFSSVMYEPYVLIFLLYHKKDYRNNKKGSAIPHLNKDLFFNMPMPIPPLAEQKRIVAKIEELLPLIDRYEQAWSRLEDFNKRFPGDMQKSILQMAIQGKLVEQRPEEGTGQDLYQQIQAEKQALIKAGKIKKEKPLPEIAEDETELEVPDSWSLCKLGTIARTITDGEHKTPRRVSEFCGYYLLSARNVRDGYISLLDVDYVDKAEYETIAKRCNPKRGDILISCSGSVGRCAVVNDSNNYVMVRSAAMVSPVFVDSNYLMFSIQSEYVQGQIRNRTKQTAQANLFQDAIRNLVIPLPPLAEQKRIVARLEELLPLCERLK